MSQHYDLIIVGGGPAGLTAAIYARRAGRSVLLLEKESFGGQIATAPKVGELPRLFSAISGAELADRMYTQAEDLGACIELEEVLSVQPGPEITVTTDYGVHTCTALDPATGMKRRTPGLPGEERLSGVSYCAVCDGAFTPGGTWPWWAAAVPPCRTRCFWRTPAEKVTVIHRRSQFRGDPVLEEALRARANVDVVLDTVVTGLRESGGALTGVCLQSTVTGETRELAVDGLFSRQWASCPRKAGPVAADTGRERLYPRRRGLPHPGGRRVCRGRLPRQGGPAADHRLRRRER